MQHTPVLLKEALTYLSPKSGKNFVDGTLGGGGYSIALLEAVRPNGKVLSIDLDSAAIENYVSRIKENVSKTNAIVVKGNFADLDKIAKRHDFKNISGIVADIGLSSSLLDQSGRGFTFQKREPLDMRFDISSDEPDAKFLLNNYSEDQLFKIFKDFGEEPFAKRIAYEIVSRRTHKPLHYTTDLAELIKNALPKSRQHKASDSNRRIFQALRIAVNHELENLERFLGKALDLLAPGGRLVVVSFHSLEDRIVKQFFIEASRGCVCPPEFPICQCGRSPQARILTKKPTVASAAEQNENPRSKPGKLRAIIKQ